MNTYFMVKRKSDEMIVKMYVVPRELPDNASFSKVVGKAYDKIHQNYPRKDYTLLIGGARSPEDFLSSFRDWTKGATVLEAEEWDCAV